MVSRQGSGVFVRERTERPDGLRPHMVVVVIGIVLVIAVRAISDGVQTALFTGLNSP